MCYIIVEIGQRAKGGGQRAKGGGQRAKGAYPASSVRYQF